MQPMYMQPFSLMRAKLAAKTKKDYLITLSGEERVEADANTKLCNMLQHQLKLIHTANTIFWNNLRTKYELPRGNLKYDVTTGKISLDDKQM